MCTLVENMCVHNEVDCSSISLFVFRVDSSDILPDSGCVSAFRMVKDSGITFFSETV
jgi:hypothetical protein